MKTTLLMIAALLLAVPVFGQAPILTQNVTPDVIFGSGNANGAFTVDTATVGAGTVELGLRAKVRFNASGMPENTFNQFAAGEYYHAAGLAPTQAGITPTWGFEWTVNTNQNGLGSLFVGDYTYELGLDYDPGVGTNYVVFDPITPTVSTPMGDHAMGDNSTPNGGGTSATSPAQYLTFLSQYNVAQQSWRFSWFDAFSTFDPNVAGVYDIYLKAISSGGVTVAETHIEVYVSYGTPVAVENETWGGVKSLYR